MAAVEHRTLVAATVTTVTLTVAEPRGDLTSFATAPRTRIEFTNVDGADRVYFTTDGTTPTVAGAGCHVFPAAIGSVEVDDETPGNTATVKMISAGTPLVSVRAL